jgi:hypothetical protein
MQVKIPNEDESPQTSKQDRSCTSSIYISQPSTVDHVRSELGNLPQNQNIDSNGSGSAAEQKPVLTIQVNQNNPTMNQSSSSNLVNIVSCFRAYPTITHSGIENVVHSTNAPFSVSVNRNHGNYGGNKSDESVNNENNQNIVNIEASLKNNASNHDESVQSKATVKCEDLNEISVDQILISDRAGANANVDYQNMSLDDGASRDQVGLIGSAREKIVITTATTGTGVNTNHSRNPQQTSGSVINQITVAGEVESSTDNRVANDNCAKNETQVREQRRRERRERRQARQRAQHGHHHAAPVHQRPTGVRAGNGVEPSRTSYEILPDIINNHLPPPYTTLPLQPPIHSPLTISPVPVVVDDCRFSFPIPIIRR